MIDTAYSKIRRSLFPVACIVALFFPATAFPAGNSDADSTRSITTDSISAMGGSTSDSLPIATDTSSTLRTAAPTPTSSDTVDSVQLTTRKLPLKADTGHASKKAVLPKPALLPADSADTATMKNGRYLSAGFGWTLGSFELMQLWESAQPDSLGSFGLTPGSCGIPFDSTLGDGQIVDTAKLSFSVKEKPANYTMCFPVMISLVRIGEHDRMSLSVGGSWMRKIFAATIAATGDTLALKVDYKETINIFSGFLTGSYGKRIPEEYLSILDIERTYLTAGIQIVPAVAGSIRRTVDAPASQRYRAIADSLDAPRRLIYGGSAGARIGLSMLKRVNSTRGMEFGAFFFINGYGYFHEKGARVQFTGIDPATTKKNKNLFWISNGFELSIALLRLHGE